VLFAPVLTILALLAFAVVTWQFIAAMRFPLHRRASDPSFTPAVSIMKPLKGCDTFTRTCLESWFTQDYAGPVQLLFAVQSADDPVCEIVRDLIAKYPSSDATLVVCSGRLGTNAKVSKLARLEELATHDLLLVSDADVLVPADYLANIVPPMRDPKIGLINSFYRLANPSTTAMRWEATAVNADFWSQVLQAKMLGPIDFALGASMLFRKHRLAEIGGFKGMVDHLADDFQLGNRMAAAGARIELSPIVVECLDAPAGWRAVWTHQLRWNRTIRVCRPLPYGASILANATLWSALAALEVWTSPAISNVAANRLLGVFISIVIVRSWMAQILANRIAAIPGRESSDSFVFGMTPLRDLLGAVVWLCSFFGSTVVWRGVTYRVNRNGTLTPV
jgi:ceramide glucosyltransferase